MTQKLEFYRCNICGNLIEVVLPGAGELVCCSQPMEKLREQTQGDEITEEKHIPLITKNNEGVEVKIGSIPHPMEEKHYIMFIEVNSEDKKYVKRKYLSPNEAPVLNLKCSCDKVIARELCNIHGLWSSQNNEPVE